jgi:hypothetical protein
MMVILQGKIDIFYLYNIDFEILVQYHQVIVHVLCPIHLFPPCRKISENGRIWKQEYGARIRQCIVSGFFSSFSAGTGPYVWNWEVGQLIFTVVS